MQEILLENIETVLADDDSIEFEALNSLLAEKQRELIKETTNGKDAPELFAKIDNLMDQKQALLVKQAQKESVKQRIQEMQEFLSTSQIELTDYDESMVRRYIKGIKVYDDRFVVTFKAGIDIDIQR